MFRKMVAVWVSLAMLLGFVVIVDVVTDIAPLVKATTITVDDSGGAMYTKIQDAINASNDGDTVFVYNGTYYENVVVNKSIDLTGEDRNITIIEGGGNDKIVQITSDWANFTGFTATNGTTGIYLSSTSNNKIVGNIIMNNGYGIWLSSSSNNNITNNYIHLNEYNGIRLVSSNSDIIINNNISTNGNGILFDSSTSLVIRSNTINGFGIYVRGKHLENWNTHDIDISNTVNGKSVYYLKNHTGGLVPPGAGQIILANCKNIFVENQEIEYSFIGMQLAFSSENVIKENNISNGYYGIYLYQSNRNNITTNRVFGNIMNGLYIIHSNNNTIKDNNISSNGLRGIYLIESNYTEIIGNTILYENGGINIHDSSNNNYINNNMVSESGIGIFLSGSAHSNTIIENNFTNNNQGISIFDSGHNLIYHNNIINNTNQAYDASSINGNHWDNGYPLGGNYWSNYTGNDSYKGLNQDQPGSDSIGDTSYIIDGDSQDNYPLMNPYVFKPLENYTILKHGWNLISTPLIQDNQNVLKVLEMIDGYYDVIQWHDPNDVSDPWKHHKQGKPFGNDLSHLNESMGFWIHINNPGDTIFLYNGTQPSTNQSITFHPGWNMVGYPSLINRTRDTALNNINYGSDVDAIWTFNAATQTWQEIGSTDYLELGRGYWIHSKVTKVWDVPL